MARSVVLAAMLVLTGCAGVSDLTKPASPALGDRTADVRKKADAALAERKYADAWNLEAQAGADRARLEAVALAALAADAGPFDDMLKALRAKFGGLSPEARAKVDGIAAAKELEGHWEDAVAVQLVAADDAPTFAAAWRVYDKTPVKDALGVLEKIQEARGDAAPAGTPK